MAKKAVTSRTAACNRAWVVVAASALAALQIAIVWLPDVPLGISGEWTWDRIPYGAPEAATLFLRLFAVLPAFALYAGISFAGDVRFAAAGCIARTAWLFSLTAAGWVFLWVVQESPTYAFDRLGRGPLVLYFPATSGYFTEAHNADDFAEYLSSYEELMSRGDVLHLGTHPPGLIALHRGLLELYERSETLVDVTLALRPESVRLTEDLLETIALAEGNPLSRADLAELWGATLLMQVAGVAALLPLYLCAARSAGSVAGWRAACLWPLVPALAIFLPKSDALYPLIGMAFLACWYRPGSAAGSGSSLLAAIVLWVGMTLSLALLPVALLASLLAVRNLMASEPARRRPLAWALARDAAVISAAFAGLSLLCYLLFDINLVTVWRWNFHNHAAFYEQFPRTYWKWLLLNPVELALAAGSPVFVCAIFSLTRTPFATSVAVPIGVVTILLWISGKNSGEAARLWLFLIPWVIWIAAFSWNAHEDRRRWRLIVVLQAVVAFLTSVRIGGFGFAEMIKDFG